MLFRGEVASTPHRFSASEGFVERLEGEERRRAIPVERILPILQLSRSTTLLDIGAGIGYFSIPISKEIKSVIALDLEPKMFEVLSGRIESLGVSNIHLLRGDMLSLPLADGFVDHVFAAFVYHEVASTSKLIHECCRVLRSHGRLTILDFQKKETGIGPPVSERKTPAQVLRAVSGKFKLLSRTDEDIYYILNLAKVS